MSMNNRGHNLPSCSGFENPDYSPAVMLANSKWDKALQTKLEEFRQSDDIELEFPTMESHLRKQIHELARRFGLQSTSVGKEPYRAVTVTRKKRFSMDSSVKASELRPLQLNDKMKQAIASFMKDNPITEEVVQDYLSEESFVKPRRRNTDFTKAYSLLIPPKPKTLPEMMAQRYQLPAYKQRSEILDAINSHQVVLITGGTGCGKTTQVPQFLMEEAYENGSNIRIICTQPRRLPAVAVAERVARERNEKCGLTVGYHIRLEQNTSAQTVLTYCTSGVLLRMLTDDEIAKDVSHIILDEIHEREQNTDYLLIALKQAVKLRKDLKIILMSATMEGNLKLFKSYFGENIHTKHVDIPSRLYHVEKFYLGDVLAMTGYIPESNFVSSGPYDSSFKESASFPNASAWNSEGIHSMPNSSSANNPAFRFSTGFGSTAVDSSPRTEWDGDKWNSISSTPVNSFSQQYRSPSNLLSSSVYPASSSQSYTHNALQNVAQQLTVSHQNAPIPNTYSVGDNPFSSHGNYNGPWDAVGYNQSVQFHPDQFSHPPPPLGQPLRHSVTWCGSENEATCYENPMDIIEMPTGCIDPDFMAEFEQMGSISARTDVHEESPHNWTHMQSMSYMPQPENSSIHHWDQHALHSGSNKQSEAPQFYIPQESVNQFQADCSHTSIQLASQAVESVGFGGTFMNNDNSFGAMLRQEQMEISRMKQTIRAALADRYKEFNPQITEKLRSRHINHRTLVDNYMRLGGSEYEDTIDVFLITHVVMHCVNSMVDGAILVFLPGYEDINQVREKLEAAPNSQKERVILTLHSQMNSQDQQRVFEPLPSSCRKIILSTNIAEASLTIDDVVFVIDCGKVKEKSYDYTSRISQLKVSWIAKSNAEQRSGRAGRCRPGFCFRLYSVDNFANMLSTQTAEMQRAAIHDVVLHARMFSPEHMSVKEFLQLAPEPPLPFAIEHSISFLEVLGAMYSTASTSDMNTSSGSTTGLDPALTAMGRLIAHLPLDPQLARLLLFGLALKCLSPVVTLVAALSHRDPFTIPGPDERERSNIAKDRFALRDLSDHLMLIRIMHEFDQKQPRDYVQFARRSFLSLNVLKMIQGIRRQLLVELKRAKLIYCEGEVSNVLRHPTYNKYSENWPMVQAAIVAGCYPGIGVVKNNNTKLRKVRIGDEQMASLHPSSVIRRQAARASKRASSDTEPLFQLLVFQEISRIDDGLALRTVSIVPPIVVLLFSGPIRMRQSTISQFQLVEDEELDAVISNEPPATGDLDWNLSLYELDENVVFRGNPEYLQLLLRLRLKLMLYFLDVMQNPRHLTAERDDHSSLLATLDVILSEEHIVENFKPVSNFSVPTDQEVRPTYFPQDCVPPKPSVHCEVVTRNSQSEYTVSQPKSDQINYGRSSNLIRESSVLEQLLPNSSQRPASYPEDIDTFAKKKTTLPLNDSKFDKMEKQAVRSEVYDKLSVSQSCDVRAYQPQRSSMNSSFRQTDNHSGYPSHSKSVDDKESWDRTPAAIRQRQESHRPNDDKIGACDNSFNGRQRINSHRAGRNTASNYNSRGAYRCESGYKPPRHASKNWQQEGGKNERASMVDEYEEYGDSHDHRSSARYHQQDFNDKRHSQRNSGGSFSNRDQTRKVPERSKNHDREWKSTNTNAAPVTCNDPGNYGCDDVRMEQNDGQTWQQKDFENADHKYRHDQGGSYDFEDVPDDPKVDKSSDSCDRRRGDRYKSDQNRNSDRTNRVSFNQSRESGNQFLSTSSRDDTTSHEERPSQCRDDFSGGRGAGRKKVFYKSKQHLQGKH